MSDTTQHCMECERLTAIVDTMRTESGVLRRECELRSDKVEQLEAELAALRAELENARAHQQTLRENATRLVIRAEQRMIAALDDFNWLGQTIAESRRNMIAVINEAIQKDNA